MAGSTSVTYDKVNYGKGPASKYVETITVAFTADAADGTVPDTTVPMSGWLVKVVTNPGSTAPTDNWDIILKDPEDTALDAAAALLKDRDTTNTEQVYPLISGAATPLFLAGSYLVNISGNSVNSATGRIIFYLVDSV